MGDMRRHSMYFGSILGVESIQHLACEPEMCQILSILRTFPSTFPFNRDLIWEARPHHRKTIRAYICKPKTSGCRVLLWHAHFSFLVCERSYLRSMHRLIEHLGYVLRERREHAHSYVLATISSIEQTM